MDLVSTFRRLLENIASDLVDVVSVILNAVDRFGDYLVNSVVRPIFTNSTYYFLIVIFIAFLLAVCGL